MAKEYKAEEPIKLLNCECILIKLTKEDTSIKLCEEHNEIIGLEEIEELVKKDGILDA